MLAVQFPPAPSSSAAGIISYLEEDDNALKVKALQKIYQIIDVHWAEICESLPLIESLTEDSSFPAADLASAIVSKCFYHLQEYNDALKFALAAGQYFNVTQKNEYIDIMLSKCIDEYKNLRQQQQTQAKNAAPIVIDGRMEQIVEQMFQRCYLDHTFEQALGIALDTYRLDKVDEVIAQAIANNQEHIVSYAFNLCQNTRNITLREFRLSVIEILVKYYGQLKIPDYSNVIFGLQYLNRPQEAAAVMLSLLQSPETYDTLLLYQIAFDLLETENQGFILKVVDELNSKISISSHSAAAETPDATPQHTASPGDASAAEASTAMVLGSDTNSDEYKFKQLRRILLDGLDIDLTLHFLFKYSHADLNTLKDIKTAIEGRSNVLHNATIIAHGYLNAGTTRDSFLRDNLDWLGKAKNWAKFTTVASIGVVHKGHIHESMNLLQPYLPSNGGGTSSPYSEAGALYALGLIHANKGGSGDSSTITYLTDALRNGGNNEIVQHGACLGIGLAAMATGNEDLFEQLRAVLFADSAVGGEGAAFGIGLVMLGQCDSPLAANILPDLLNYLHDTKHEKIIRALSLSIAMMVYGKEESADVIIETLARDRDPIVRYGAMFAIAMAYCGTGDNAAIRKLLHVAVSDVNDDVRRAAVMSLGFLLFRHPDMIPKLVSLLAESFNPHVRYGTCMALGIACAGTGNKDALDLLFPLLEDTIDFVRQGAMMAIAMIFQQTSEARSPSIKKFRDTLASIITDKHQPILAKSGAIIATGMLDAAGGNAVISLASKGGGFLKMGATIGMMMFLQHWYWYPLYPFLSLSFTPTMLMGLNAQFDIPTDFEVICNAPPSLFAYPKIEEKKEDEKKLVATAVLSTTLKTKAREARKEAKKAKLQGGISASMDTNDHHVKEPGTPGSAPGTPGGKLGGEAKESSSLLSEGIPLERIPSHLSTASYLSLEADKPATEVKPKKTKEPTSFTISNPSRVIPTQLRFLSLPTNYESQRYVPIKSKMQTVTGIVMLIDEDPSAPETVIKVERLSLGQDEIASPPEPFEWDPNDP